MPEEGSGEKKPVDLTPEMPPVEGVETTRAPPRQGFNQFLY